MADLFAQQPGSATVAVLPFPPGEADITDEMLVATQIDSDYERPLASAGRLIRDETITIEWTVMVNGTADEDVCMTRFDEIVGYVDSTIAEDATLGGFAGVLDAMVTGSAGKPARSSSGFYVIGTVTTVIETRLH